MTQKHIEIPVAESALLCLNHSYPVSSKWLPWLGPPGQLPFHSAGNFWLSLPELVQSSTGPDLAAALTWRQGASSLGKQFLGLNGKEKLLLLTGSVLPWVLCILVDLGLFTQTGPSTVQERTILSTRWFSRNCFCFYLPTKCFLAVCFWRQLPCSPDLSSVGCCLSSLRKQSFSSFDSIFCF